MGQSRPEVHAELLIQQKKASLLAYDFIPQTGGIAYVTYKSPHSTRYLALTITDDQFHPLSTVNLPALSKTHYFYDIHVIGNHIWLFYIDETSSSISLCYHLYTVQGRPRKLSQILIQSERTQNKYLTKSLKFKKRGGTSPALLILNPTFNLQDNADEMIQAFLIEEHDEEPEEFQIRLPEKDLEMEFVEAALARNNDIFLLTRLFPPKERQPQTKLYHYLYHPKVVIDVSLQTGEKGQWLDVTLRLDTANFVYLAGFYGDEQRSRVYGFFFYKISPISHEIIVSQYTEVPDSVKEVYKGLWKKRSEGISSIYLDQSIITADGGIILLAERFYLSYEPYYIGPTGFYPYRPYYAYGTSVNYNYEDIFVFKLTHEGNLEWIQKITKFQSGESNESLSYNVFITPQHLYFFYYALTKRYGPNLYYVVMDTTGQVTPPSPLFSQWHSSSIYFRKMAIQISAHYALLLTYHRRKHSFVLSKIFLP